MFSATLLRHFNDPQNAGELADADRIGRGGSPDHGPQMAVFLRLDGDTIVAARYETAGCGVTIAAGSAMTQLVIGRTLPECLALTPDTVVEALDGLPAHKMHCAELAIDALHQALQADEQPRNELAS